MSIQLKPTMLRRHQLSDTFIPDNLNDYRPRNGYHLNPQNSLPLPLDMRNNQNSAQYSDVLPSLHKMAYAFEAGFAQESRNHTQAFNADLFDRKLDPVHAHITHTMHRDQNTKLTQRYTGITITYTPLIDSPFAFNRSGYTRVMNQARAGLAITGMYVRDSYTIDTVAVLHTYLENTADNTLEFNYNNANAIRLASLGADTEQFNPRSVAHVAIQAMRMLTMPITTSMVELNPNIAHGVDSLLNHNTYLSD